MKKVWFFVILVLVAIFGGRVWYLNKNKTDETNTVKIGLLSFNSGLYGDLGIALDNGAKLAIKEINAKENVKLDLHIVDGKGFPKEAVNAFNKLNTDNIDFMIVAGENQVPPVAPLIEQRKIPTILTSVGTLSFIENNKNRYMFLVNPSAKETGFAMGNYAHNTLHLKKVAILSVLSVYGKEASSGFIQGYGQPKIWEQFKETDLDVRNIITKILTTEPDGVYIIGYGPGYVNAINQLKEQGYNGIIMSDYTVVGQEVQENVKNKNNIYFAQAENTENTTRLEDFQKAYRNEYQKEPSYHSQLGYDAVYIISNAIQGSFDYRKNLEQLTDIETFFGLLNFNKDGSSNFKIYIKQMQPDGTAKIIKE